MKMRLQKFLAQCGIASRRKSEELIKEGCISVNDIIIKDMGFKIDTGEDIIKYKGRNVIQPDKKIYIKLYKPTGYITTSREQFGRKKVTDLLYGLSYRVYPVGRLDYNTSGLLILTNDGDMAFKMTHPSSEVNKTYIAKVRGVPGKEDLKKLREGILIEDYITSPASVEVLKNSGSNSVLSITIHEGKNRQIRKMCSAVGLEVTNLKRVSIGELTLGDLNEGEWRYLSDEELKYLKDILLDYPGI
jgi:23S rRNA pseudouridine2605 synthase